MKYLLFAFLMFFVASANYAQLNSTTDQKGVKITGKVVDEKSGNSLDFATVTVINNDGTPFRGGQSDLNGKFTFESVPAGNYSLKVSFVGYKPLIQTLSVKTSQPLLDLGSVKVIKASGSTLNEVVVTGRKDVIQLGIDRKVFNADQSLVSQGGSASDLLATVPSVQVDLDGNVSLRGTSNVRVLIDGKPSTFGGGNITSILQSLPASAIEKVELITNPSSKYDPEGQSGIINIVLKKNQKIGLNGNVALTAGRFNNYNANGSLNYRDETWNLSGNYSYRYSNRPGSGSTNTTFLNPSSNVAPYSYSSQISNNFDKDHTLKLGAEYYATPLTSISVSGNLQTGKALDRDDLSQRFLSQNNTLLDYGTGFTNQNESNYGYDLNLDLNQKFNKKDEVLTGNFSYGNGNQDQLENINQLFFDSNGAESVNRISSNRRNDVNERNNNYNIQLDYTLPLNKESKFEAGYRTTLKYNDENQISDTLITNTTNFSRDNGQSNLFQLEDLVHAVYSNYQNQITKNFGFQVGLRAEQAYLNTTITGLDGNGQTLITPNRLNYLRIYPSVFLTQKFKGENQLQLSYSRRVNRPRGWQTNPFPDRSDRYNIRVGNPNLRPEDIHSFELAYAKYLQTVTFTSSIYFRQVNDVVQSIRDNNPNELGGTISRFYNISRNRSVGLELISRADITKKWNVTGNLNFFQSYFKGDKDFGINDNSGFNWNGNLTSNITLPKDISAQVSAFYSAPRTLSQGRMKEMVGVDAGLRYDVLNKKGSISLNVRDIFNTRRYGLLTDNGLFIQEWERRRQGGIYNITFSYRFGSQNVDSKKPQKRTSQQSEEDTGY